MPMSKPMQRVWDELVVPYDKGLDAYDFTSEQMVEVRHQDGTHLYFHCAMAKVFENDWVAVFTEHNGTHLFSRGDIEYVRVWGNKQFICSTDDEIVEDDDDAENG